MLTDPKGVLVEIFSKAHFSTYRSFFIEQLSNSSILQRISKQIKSQKTVNVVSMISLLTLFMYLLFHRYQQIGYYKMYEVSGIKLYYFLILDCL